MAHQQPIRWLSPKEFLAAHPEIGRNGLYDALSQGRLPHIKLSPKRFRIPEDALERALTDRQRDKALVGI